MANEIKQDPESITEKKLDDMNCIEKTSQFINSNLKLKGII